MHFQLELIGFLIYFLQVIFVTAFTVRIGHFKVSKRSPKINQCASMLLSKGGFSGFLRVSEYTGQCEELSGPWDEEINEGEIGRVDPLGVEDNFEPVFENATLIFTNVSFRPPVSLRGFEKWNTSSSITSWSRLSIYVTWPKRFWDRVVIGPYGKTWNGKLTKDVKMKIFGNIFKLDVYETGLHAEETYYDKRTGRECNVTFASNGNNAVNVLLNETTMATWTFRNGRIDRLEGIYFFYVDIQLDRRFLVHGIEYIQA